MPEGGRAFQTAHDLPAQGAVVMVEHGHVHMAHFHGGGPAEHDDLHERRHDDQHAGDGVAEQDQQLLAHDGQHAPDREREDITRHQTSSLLTSFL